MVPPLVEAEVVATIEGVGRLVAPRWRGLPSGAEGRGPCRPIFVWARH